MTRQSPERTFTLKGKNCYKKRKRNFVVCKAQIIDHHVDASVFSRNALESELDLVLKGGKQKTRRHLWPLGNVSKHSSEQPTSNTHILGSGQVICLPWTFKGSGQEALPSCRLESRIGGWVHKLKGREMDVRVFTEARGAGTGPNGRNWGFQLVSDDIGWW